MCADGISFGLRSCCFGEQFDGPDSDITRDKDQLVCRSKTSDDSQCLHS